jgi:hypothetical protein
MKNFSLFTWMVFFSLFSTTLIGQNLTQTIRGTVVDKETKFPLIGVTVVVKTTDGQTLGASTDIEGAYRVEKVPLGRQGVEFSYIGYQQVANDNIIVSSAKEVILNVEMEESAVDVETVEILGQRNGEVLNEIATVSAREFSVEETNRYAGSRGEPARMASNFAGVQGADDSRNDIIVRGNSPSGVLWRLEGINIPNPNHFSIAGTGGGSVTILNNKFLANSDFFTGAFPAQYGNSIAGAFDLRMRNGNNEKHEFSGQLGFLGTELMAEGPLNKKGASYLTTFRYSTLALFSFMNINVGTDAIPKYYDGAFRLNFPIKKGGSIALWGIGGNSEIDIALSETQIEPDTATLIYGSNDRDQFFATSMYTVGATYTQPLDQNTFVKAGAAYSRTRQYANHDYIFRHVENNVFVYDSLPNILDYTFTEGKVSAYFAYHKKVNHKFTLKLGLNLDVYALNYIDSARTVFPATDSTGASLSDWQIRWNATGSPFLIQPYAQFKYNASERLTLTGGLTSLYYSINDISLSPIEPRFGLTYDLGNGQKLSFGTGLHSQNQSNYLYYYGTPNGSNPITYNKNAMGLTKSYHAVLGYDKSLKGNMRFKAETYYQYLYNIPVDIASSSYSLVNTGSGFSRLFPDSLENGGVGRNYGLEFTLEKFFSGGYYFLVTASLFDAKYQGSDDVWRNTTFNGRYAFNGLIAKEFGFKNGSALNIGGKATLVGGRWYGDVDETASAQQLEIIYIDESVNKYQFRPYFRVDAKISYLWNRPKVSHEIAIDLVNVLNIKNILTLTYSPDSPDGNPIREEYQLGFLPLFYYKIDF